MTIYVTWEQATSYAAAVDRYALAALLTKSAVNTPLVGVIPSGGADLAVAAQGSPNMTVAVAAGQCICPAATGGYIGTNTASQNVTITTANGTNPRIDLIVFQVLDTEAGDGSTTGQIVAIAGTPNASPTAPATPARSIVLAQVRVDAAVSSIVSGNITDTRAYTVGSGGCVPCTSTTHPTSPYLGMLIFETDTLTIKVCTNTTGPVWSVVYEDTGYATPTLGNSWVSYALTDATFGAPQYRRMHGIVYLEGEMNAGTANTTIFTLPAGYRPSKTRSFAVQSNIGQANVLVFANGNVQVNNYNAAGSNASVSLNGITFPAEA